MAEFLLTLPAIVCALLTAFGAGVLLGWTLRGINGEDLKRDAERLARRAP